MTDGSQGDAGTPVRWNAGLRIAGLLLAYGGVVMLGRLDRTGVSAGVLLLVAALALLGVGIGRAGESPDAGGRLDLSTRLAVGLLGGGLGGLAYLAVALAGDAVGVPDLFGSGWVVSADAARWGSEAARGAVWGVVLGLVLPWLPGRDPLRQGAVFAVVPALWVGLVTFPGLEFGTFGVRLGTLTMVSVLLYHGVWGLVAGGALRWARETEHAPLSRPLGA